MKNVMILMSTYNGGKFLRTQLDSILAQQGVAVQILVRDDGSTDETLQILDEYSKQGKLSYYTGENLRPAKSFMDLIHKAPQADYYAFADQDDYWLPEKLSRAIKKLEKMPAKTPCLYHSKTTLVDKDLKLRDYKPMPSYFCNTFPHVLITFLAIGCTFVFNKTLKDIVAGYRPDFQIPHDNWLDQVCRAIGGSVIYDDKSYIYYRQHGQNVSGGTSDFTKKWKRRWHNIIRKRCMRSKSVAELVKGYGALMPSENLSVCREILDYKKGLKYKYTLLRDKRMRTNKWKLDCNYFIAVLLGIF